MSGGPTPISPIAIAGTAAFPGVVPNLAGSTVVVPALIPPVGASTASTPDTSGAPNFAVAPSIAGLFADDDSRPIPFSVALSLQGEELRAQNERFVRAEMPHVLLVSTHGYAGPAFPASAPDSGGQIIYVNNLARELAELGYKVTVVTRAFRPQEQYRSYGERCGAAFMPDKQYVRYLYIPGISDAFVPKEHIYPELPEIALNLAQVLAEEAGQAGRPPWGYIKWINSHYVDAAVVTQMLISIWQRDIIARHFAVKPSVSAILGTKGFWLGTEIPVNLFYVFGKIITEIWAHESGNDLMKEWDYETVLRWVSDKFRWRDEQTREAVTTLGRRGVSKWSGMSALAAKQYHVGQIILEVDWRLDFDGLKPQLDRVNIHAFTPHSIGRIKRVNIRRSGSRMTPHGLHALHFPEREAFERDVVVDGDRMGSLGAQPGYAGTMGPIPNLPPAAVLLPTSQDIAEELQSMGAWPGMPSFYFPPGTDLGKFKPRASVSSKEVRELFAYLVDSGKLPRELAGQMLANPQSFNIIIEAGRMDATKRKDILVRAMTGMPSDTILFITGLRDEEGVYDSLDALITELGLQDRVFLLGMVPEEEHKPTLMSLPHGTRPDQFRLVMAASASRMEGWGMAVQEMTAGGLPLVASPFVPYARLLEKHNGGAIIVRPGDDEPSLYARAMQQLVSDPEEARQIARKGLGIAQNYGWSALVERYTAAMEEIFGRRYSADGRKTGGRRISAPVHAIILAGGPGRGMQPLSSAELPKQFLRLTDPDRTGLQLTYQRARRLAPPENVWVSTRHNHASIVRQQLKDGNVRVVGEPLQRNTAPAVAMIMQQIARQDPDALVLVLPADHFFAGAEIFAGIMDDTLRFAIENSGLVTFGIVPDHLSPRKNYIEISQSGSGDYHEALNLLVKPDADELGALADNRHVVRHGEILVTSARAFMGALGRYAPVMHSGLLRLMSGVPLEEGISVEHMRRFLEELREDSFLGRVLLRPAALYGGELFVRILPSGVWADLESWRDVQELLDRGAINPPQEVLAELERLRQSGGV